MRIAIASVAAVGLTALAWPAAASAGVATNCNTPVLEGPDPSEWFTDSISASVSGRILDKPQRSFFDDYGTARIDDVAYDNSANVDGCTTRNHERNYPAHEVSGLTVVPKIYVSKRNTFARVLTKISNPGGTAESFTFEWGGVVDQDFADVGASSNGNAAMNAADRWATTCQDDVDNGCSDVTGESPYRSADLAHNWEGRGRKQHSADLVNQISNTEPALFEFDDVRVGPGKTVTFMQVVSMARTIEAANKAARRIDRKPRKYGVFKGMSKGEIRKLQNWNPKQAKRKRRR